jgi:hypothetical protein
MNIAFFFNFHSFGIAPTEFLGSVFFLLSEQKVNITLKITKQLNSL